MKEKHLFTFEMSVYHLSVSAFNIVSKNVGFFLFEGTGQDWTGQGCVWDVQFPEVIFKRRTFPLIYYGLLVRYKRKYFEA